jgi:hypothetical protein
VKPCSLNIDQYTRSHSTVDKRLEKYGIPVEHHSKGTFLIGPFGTLFATPEGSSTHFERALMITDFEDFLVLKEMDDAFGRSAKSEIENAG